MSKIYDLIIIGAGPAGITAGVYAARKKMDCLVLAEDIGGQAAWSGDIENYTGYQFITGPELASKFEEHIKEYDIEVKEGESVLEFTKEDEIIKIRTDKAEYSSRTAIIASGKRTRELGVPGETEFKNKGLTYCATCDGPLFEGKDVVIVGGGNSALDAALQLVKIAKTVYIVNISPDLGGDAIMKDKVLADVKVTVFNNSKVIKVSGDKFVRNVTIETDGEQQELNVEGVFVEIGLIPNSEFVECLDKNKLGEIMIDAQTQTSLPGIFAAGDVTNVEEKQIIIAAGEGAKAALTVFGYLARKGE